MSYDGVTPRAEGAYDRGAMTRLERSPYVQPQAFKQALPDYGTKSPASALGIYSRRDESIDYSKRQIMDFKPAVTKEKNVKEDRLAKILKAIEFSKN